MTTGPHGANEVGGRRYSAVAMALHWAIALLLIGQILLGWNMASLDEGSSGPKTFEPIHISIGLTILCLTVLRILWRLTHRPPPLPAGLARWERVLAETVHVLLYAMMLALPLTGWFMESIGPRPVPFWGVSWPHFPSVNAFLAGGDRREIKEALEGIHGSAMVWVLIALVGLHVAGALKHQFDGSPVLWRMAPFLKRPTGQ